MHKVLKAGWPFSLSPAESGCQALGYRALDKGILTQGGGGHSTRSKLRQEPPRGRGGRGLPMESLGRPLTHFTLSVAEPQVKLV